MIEFIASIIIVVVVGVILYIFEKGLKKCREYTEGLEKKCADLEEYNQVLINQLAHEVSLKQKIAEDNMALIEENAELMEKRR